MNFLINYKKKKIKKKINYKYKNILTYINDKTIINIKSM